MYLSKNVVFVISLVINKSNKDKKSDPDSIGDSDLSLITWVQRGPRV